MPGAPDLEAGELRLLLDAVLEREAAGIALLSVPDLRYLYCNDSYRRLAPAGEILGRTYTDVWGETAEALPPDAERIEVAGRVCLLHRFAETPSVSPPLGWSDDLHAAEILLAATDSMASLDVGEVLQTVIEAMRQATACDRVAVLVQDTDRGEVVFENVESGEPLRPGERLAFSALSHEVRRVFDERRTIVVDYETTGISAEAQEEAAAHCLRQVLYVPLLVVDHLLGAIAVDDTRERHEFTGPEVELAEGIASQAAIALENARLYEALADAARLSERLSAIEETVHSSLESSEILMRAVEEGARALGADSGALTFYEDGSFRVGYAYGFHRDIVGAVMPPEKEQHSLLALATRDIVVIDDARTDGRCDGEHLAALGVGSVVVCPLIVLDEPIADLYFNHAGRHAFTTAEIEFVRRLGSSLSLAVQNAQAYESEHRIAQTLQEALLQLPTDVPGISLAHVYEAAAHTARVGGDFYDVFELEHNLLGLVIGDVSGKGLDAAVLTALVKNTIRAHAVVKGNTPAQVLRNVNTVLLKESRPETYVTVFFGMLDRRDGRLVYCNAGHPAGLVLRTNGMAGRLPPNSPIAGAFSAASFANSEAQIGNSELLFLYTDGLTEARAGGELYGEERLFVQLAYVCDTDPTHAIRRVVDDVVRFAGGKLSDDVAVLAIRRQPLSVRVPVQQKLPLWTHQT